jgi:pimeloyl-ACP methyl ester carboxylesterase
LIAPLARRHTVIAPDLPGCGATPRANRSLGLDELADLLVATVTAENLASFSVAAFSMGCAIAIRAAVRHPDRITALILVAGFTHVDARLRLWLELYSRLYDGPADVLAQYNLLAAYGDAYLDRLTRAQQEELIALFMANRHAGGRDQLDLVLGIDVRADLPHVRAPTLVIRASADHLVASHHSARLASEIPGARLADIDSGHLIVVERPRPLLLSIQGFLSECSDRGQAALEK